MLGGRCVAGVGILPFDAVVHEEFPAPTPVTRVFNRSSWLGEAGTEVRGYVSHRWTLAQGPVPVDCPTCYGPLTDEADTFYHHHAVGGLVHLHLGALEGVVQAFSGPNPASLTLPSNRPR